MAFVDIDSTQERVHGHKKQGAAFGHAKIQGNSLLVRGLNALAATISTPLAAPVIAATRRTASTRTAVRRELLSLLSARRAIRKTPGRRLTLPARRAGIFIYLIL